MKEEELKALTHKLFGEYWSLSTKNFMNRCSELGINNATILDMKEKRYIKKIANNNIEIII